MTALVIIPTYNEADNIADIVGQVREVVPAIDILIVDDSSPDGTGKIADELAEQDDQVHVLHRLAKTGLGGAYLAGFDWGLRRGYDVLVEMDADGSHPVDRLGVLVESAESGVDLTIGSRWVPGGAVVNWPKHREWLSRGASLYVRFILGLQVDDVTAGFRAYRASALQQLDLLHVASHGYCFQIDLTRRARDRGLQIREIPITFVERVRGESKMTADIVTESLWRVTLWGFTHRVRQLVGLVR